MSSVAEFHQERGNVRTYRRSDRLGYIIRELPRRLELLSRALDYPADGRVLDYGCADVPYRSFFPASVEYLAADLPGNADATMTINLDGTLPVEDASVDIVLSTQVLEHVADPSLYLAECARILRPSGQLLLSTHGFMVHHPDPVDLWRWTCEGLREAVTRSGLEVARFEGIMGITATALQLLQDGLYYRLPHGLRGPFAYLMQSLISFADRHEPIESRDRNALVFALIASKPQPASQASGGVSA